MPSTQMLETHYNLHALMRKLLVFVRCLLLSEEQELQPISLHRPVMKDKHIS